MLFVVAHAPLSKSSDHEQWWLDFLSRLGTYVPQYHSHLIFLDANQQLAPHQCSGVGAVSDLSAVDIQKEPSTFQHILQEFGFQMMETSEDARNIEKKTLPKATFEFDKRHHTSSFSDEAI